jgi:hypothetical protein
MLLSKPCDGITIGGTVVGSKLTNEWDKAVRAVILLVGSRQSIFSNKSKASGDMILRAVFVFKLCYDKETINNAKQTIWISTADVAGGSSLASQFRTTASLLPQARWMGWVSHKDER